MMHLSSSNHPAKAPVVPLTHGCNLGLLAGEMLRHEHLHQPHLLHLDCFPWEVHVLDVPLGNIPGECHRMRVPLWRPPWILFPRELLGFDRLPCVDGARVFLVGCPCAVPSPIMDRCQACGGLWCVLHYASLSSMQPCCVQLGHVSAC